MQKNKSNQYVLLRDLPYYAEPRMTALAGWLFAGGLITALETQTIEQELWIRHEKGWTLAKRGDVHLAKLVEEKTFSES